MMPVIITLPPEDHSEASKSAAPCQRSRFLIESVVRSLKGINAKRLAKEYEEAAPEIKKVNEDLDGAINDGVD